MATTKTTEAGDTQAANIQTADVQKDQPTNAEILKGAAAAGVARVRRLGFDPNKIGETEAEQLRRLGIDSETFERKAVTYQGLIQEFGKPVGPRLYNQIAVTGFGGVPSNRADLSIMTLQDDYIMPRKRDESDEAFNERLKRHRARREKVEQLIAEAEGGAS